MKNYLQKLLAKLLRIQGDMIVVVFLFVCLFSLENILLNLLSHSGLVTVELSLN